MRFNILNFAEYGIAVLMLVVLFHKGDKIVQNAIQKHNRELCTQVYCDIDVVTEMLFQDVN